MPGADTIRFAPWDWNLALSDNVIVLCGERCAAGLLSRSLGEWKQDALRRDAEKSLAAA